MSNPFYEPFYGMERFIEQAFSGREESDTSQDQRSTTSGHGRGDKAARSLKPKMDLHEDSEKNMVTASFEFPGLTKDDVQTSLHNGRLTVAADTRRSTEYDEKGYAVRERQFGRFWRTIQLPLGVKEDQIKASMKDGVLCIIFPKMTQERAPNRVEIN